MSSRHIEFLVEDRSAEALLRALLPTLFRDLSFEVYPSRSKEDLLNNLLRRLRGYSSWLPKDYCIVVLVDCDDASCRALKEKLEGMSKAAGLVTRTSAQGRQYQVVNRLAVEEIEAWFFGDWQAVCAAYPGVNPNVPQKSKFRDPDRIKGGTKEALERLLQDAGYFTTGLRRIELARTVAEHMDPQRNRSRSFRNFWRVVTELAS